MAQDNKQQNVKPGTPAPQPAAPAPKSAAEIGAEIAAKIAAEAKVAAAPSVDVAKVAEAALKEVEAKRLAEANAPAPTNTGKMDRWPDRKRKSTVANPVKFVWDLAEAMTAQDPTIRRKDIVETAIKHGVAGYTARTQYQAWYTAKRESQRQAARREVEAAQKAAGQK